MMRCRPLACLPHWRRLCPLTLLLGSLAACTGKGAAHADAQADCPGEPLQKALAEVDTVGNMLIEASMAENRATEAPLGFQLGASHAMFRKRMEAIAKEGHGRTDGERLTYFTDHSAVNADLIVTNRSLFSIGMPIPDTLRVSKIEYAYHLPDADSLQAMNIVRHLMDATSNGKFQASPVIAMQGHFEQLWTRQNLAVKVCFNRSNSTLYFYAFDAASLSRDELLGIIATFKAEAAKCHISLHDLKQRIYAFIRQHHKNYIGQGGWKVDWYTTDIVVRHRYQFTDKSGQKIFRRSVFHLDYRLQGIREFVSHEHGID